MCPISESVDLVASTYVIEVSEYFTVVTTYILFQPDSSFQIDSSCRYNNDFRVSQHIIICLRTALSDTYLTIPSRAVVILRHL